MSNTVATDRLIVLHPARWTDGNPEPELLDRLKGTNNVGMPVLIRLWASDSAIVAMATRNHEHGVTSRSPEVHLCALVDGYFMRIPMESIASWAFVHATTTLSKAHVEGLIEQAMTLATPGTPKDPIATRLGRLMLSLGALREALTVFRAPKP